MAGILVSLVAYDHPEYEALRYMLDGFEKGGYDVQHCVDGTLEEKTALIEKKATKATKGTKVVYLIHYRDIDTADLIATAVRTGHQVCVWSWYERGVMNIVRKALAHRQYSHLRGGKVKVFRPNWNGAAALQQFILAL